MNISTAIRIIEIDEAIYQLQEIFKEPINSKTYRYIINKLYELQTEKQILCNILDTNTQQ